MDPEITKYKNISKTEKPYFVFDGYDTLAGFAANCLHGGWLQKLFKKLQQPGITKKRKNLLKTFIPAYTISANYKPGRKIIKNLKAYNQLLTFDIDLKGNEHITDWPGLRDKIFYSWPEVTLAALSASGKGCFFVLRLEEKSNPENHKQFFEVIKEALKKIGITIDRSCSDIGRLRFMTCDPGLKYRYKTKVFELPPQPPKKPRRTPKKAPQGDVYAAAMNYAIKKHGAFMDGNKHMFIASVTTTLKNAGIPAHDREAFVYNNLLDKSEITTNCINRT